MVSRRETNLPFKNPQAGATLTGILISLALVSIGAMGIMAGLSGYYDGKKRLDTLDSAGEAQDLIVAQITDLLRKYVLFYGCTLNLRAGVPANLRIFSTRAGVPNPYPTRLATFRQEIQSIRGSSAQAVNSRLGTLCRMGGNPAECPNVVFERDGGVGGGSNPRSYELAVEARARCPDEVGAPGHTAFENCFRFLPNQNNPNSLAKHSFLQAGNNIFIHVRSEILDLSNLNPVSCTNAAVSNAPNASRNALTLRRCAVTGANLCGCIGNTGTSLTNPCVFGNNYFESQTLGSGVRHTYTMFWESGPANGKKYFRKTGVVHVPNTPPQ